MDHEDLPIIDKNLMDIVEHGTAGFPIQYYVDELYRYPNQMIPLHWHRELEFYVAHGGPIQIQFGKTPLTLEAGNGVFINSNVLHSFKQTGEYECKCPNIVFSHELLAASYSKIYHTYIQPITTDDQLPYFVLHQDCSWHEDILFLLDKVFSLLQKYGSFSSFYGEFPMLPFKNSDIVCPCFEMETQCILNKIWQILYANKDSIPKIPAQKSRHLLQIRTQKMLKYIHNNYSAPISLKEIADSADISRSEASRCFQSYLQTSPMNYLLNYRLEQAKLFLQQSDDNIVEISDKCGFQSASYFGKIFRRETGMTASQYRKANQNRYP
ncbi:MAG: AraC family transcriptional regulator [Eubacteriales bacterium]|nr:AraC family transcriptional regulator [Eubacteriales bacterium]